MTKKSKPRKLWYYHEAPDLPIKGDPRTMGAWLGVNVGLGAYFHLHSHFTGSRSPFVKASTVQKALAKKHLDVECWVYVNRLKPLRVLVQKSDGTSFPDTRWVAAKAPINWVLDMDAVPDIEGDTPSKRIESLLKKFKKFRCPEPLIVVETSPKHFHIVYGGTEAYEWTLERRYAVALRAAGARCKVLTRDERDNLLRAGGVDPAYLKQNVDLAKFRLPGSVNIKKSAGSLDAPGKAVIAHGWYNHEYKAPSMEVLADLDKTIPPKKDRDESPTPKDFPDAAWQRFVPYVRKALVDIVKPTLLEPLTEYLSKNFNFLQKGICRILQTHMANALRIEQWGVSRLLKLLKECGILVQTGDYIQKKKAKSYGAGPALKEAFAEALNVEKAYDIDRPYESGAFNHHYLEDLRYLARLGTPVDDVVQIIMEKQEHRPKEKRRASKEIARAYLSWLNRSQHSEDLAG